MGIKNLLSSLLLAAPLVLAHPGKEKVHAHRALPLERKSLDHCEKHFSDPEFVTRTVEIHGREFARLRRELGLETEESPKLKPRDYISVSRIDHKSNKTVTKGMDLSNLFSDAGACMLMPAVDQGPLYVKGEQVRKDITEKEPGIKMTLAIQVVDYKTCKAVPNAYVDIWSSNSTGIYTGVQGYPGMGDPKDASILKLTALRGIQPTDDHGVAAFDGLLPGHYEGRATHIHAIVYLGATKQANNTITGGKAAHVGQLYFDQSLLTAVNKITPYMGNKQAVTLNTADFLFMQGANGDDPIVRYALVGKTLADGVFAWIRFGINQNANKAVSPAAFMGPSGGVMNPNGPVAQLQRGGFGGGGFGFGKRDAARHEDEKAEE
ncbi:Intradiol ring-cleavage dioxygenase [Lasiosphaeria miniovina]|uniref:Intradiol ring-cleavage dioxygenase n=1 Tax=Lasiosphaeria miniovina TaxID=1954250 RepID=A0AA40AJ46_9PEZI|nr:Intradiol ring-cleavage dioxygenase [Lasiosphaeria miniovina]KAK0716772.1 Intradiol ring-cleavage dioxygenase [Lasiosphaeria miniovina]